MSSHLLARNSAPRKGNLIEYQGRKPGKMAGTEVLDLAALCKSLVLCRLCRMKFDHRRHRYIKTVRWGWVGGKCDGCNETSMQNHFYVHESLENQVYTP